MVRNVHIDWDLEETPLEIRTDSALESDEQVIVRFHNAAGDEVGVNLWFRTTLQYLLPHCSESWTDLPTTPPSSVHKVWRITKVKTSGIRVIVYCNGEEVLNVLLSDTTCSYSNWKEETWRDYWKWNNDVEKIQFHSGDKASDGYRPGI